jgi:predicted anti-sigma-YlaC factor YlaD
MISCLLHQPALRRHLDDAEPLSERTTAHLKHCRRCREMFAAHSTMIKHLSAEKLEAEPTPAFLHARIMSSLERKNPEPREASRVFKWAGAFGCVALAAVLVATMRPKQAQQTGTWPVFETEIAFKATLPANPLETEIANLRADTLNAAKGLAANFLPSQLDSE